jgi:hypothetical protein
MPPDPLDSSAVLAAYAVLRIAHRKAAAARQLEATRQAAVAARIAAVNRRPLNPPQPTRRTR